MEAFYAGMSGIVAVFGGMTFFYVMLRRDIQKMATDLEGGILRVEDRVIRLDDRVREVEGDMKAVKYQLADKRRASRRSCADRDPLRPG